MTELRLNNYELRTAFDAYLRRRGNAPIRTLQDLIDRKAFIAGGNQERRYKETMTITDLEHNAEYLDKIRRQGELRRDLVELMRKHRVDLLVYPVKSLPAPPLGDSDTQERDNSISAVTQLPAIVLHVAVDTDGQPYSLELLGDPFSEQRLIAIAAACERVLPPRPVSKLVPPLRN